MTLPPRHAIESVLRQLPDLFDRSRGCCIADALGEGPCDLHFAAGLDDPRDDPDFRTLTAVLEAAIEATL